MKDSKVDIAELSNEEMYEVALNKNFWERSEIAQEIVSRKPDFFEKWSLLLFLMVILSLIGASWFIRYPDIIEANAILIGENAPKEIISRQSGHLIALLVKNNQKVKQGEIIAWIESNANTQEIISLSKN
ncbi:HlyD family secretion protein [Niabella hibiscisoli]|uniref:biotin/lipoyl-binding protein n=1 Tax=Niabella hibiscisoli TaxID=1825928 RepID=UPI001F0E1548|nr:biotin/lipoyl-binding protein [Niabella hibiscisoli]MCH5716248.1 biotin/lipoyl-binding protein [Niabella hibiscisoli]